MAESPPFRATPGWALAASLAVAVAAVAASPPLVGFEGGALVFAAFEPFCHQLAARSPHAAGVPFALCHRCFGVAAGLAAGVLAGPLAPRLLARVAARHPLAVLGVAAVPAGLDWVLGVAGVWANSGASRLATGAGFGVAAGRLLAAAFCAPRPAPHPDPTL